MRCSLLVFIETVIFRIEHLTPNTTTKNAKCKKLRIRTGNKPEVSEVVKTDLRPTYIDLAVSVLRGLAYTFYRSKLNSTVLRPSLFLSFKQLH